MPRSHILVLLFCTGALFLAGCGGSSKKVIVPDDGGGGGAPVVDDGQVDGTSTTPSTDLELIAARVDAVLALHYNTTTAQALAPLLFDGDPGNDPFIVDSREPTDYAQGHIPGAINIPLQTLPQALINGTSGIPMDQDVVVASYWGNDGNMASFLINCYRIADPADAASYPTSRGLFQGMTTWSFRRDLVPANSRFEDAQAAGIVVVEPTESAPNAGVDQGAFPQFRPFQSDDVVQMILARARDYLNSVPHQLDFQIYPNVIADLVNGGSAPQLISVRGGSHYAAGHFPGAINIPYRDVADLVANTNLVDPTTISYVYCYTGHTGTLSTMALGILGYPARNVLYGMNGWTQDPAVASGQLANFDLMRAYDFPLDDGGPDDLGSLAAFVPATGCQGCHTDLSSLFYDREVANPPPTAEAPPSEGEG